MIFFMGNNLLRILGIVYSVSFLYSIVNNSFFYYFLFAVYFSLYVFLHHSLFCIFIDSLLFVIILTITNTLLQHQTGSV